MKLIGLSQQPKVCIVSCSVLKRELQQLVKEGKLNAELVFVSKIFHVEYEALETNLRKVLEHTKERFKGKIVLVYGDLCLGLGDEMKKLADQYGVVKVDALNCVDCQLGGKGAFLAADPEHNLMFMGPGMIDFFGVMRENLKRAGMAEDAFSGLFSGIKGAVVLDTCGDGEKLIEAMHRAKVDLPVLEVRKVGTEGVYVAVKDAIAQASRIN